MPSCWIAWIMSFFLVTPFIFSGERAWSDERPETPSTLTVSATGLIHRLPDIATVTLSVETAGGSLEQVQTDNQDKMHRILNRLRDLDIKDGQLQTSALTISPQYSSRRRRDPGQHVRPDVPKIIGYTVNHRLRVKVYRVSEVGRIVDGALQAGANKFSGITWNLKESHAAKLAALKTAAHKAREKAVTLAQALDVQLLGLLQVSEGGASVRPRGLSAHSARMSMAFEEAGNVPVSPGELTIQGTVTLVFKIGRQ